MISRIIKKTVDLSKIQKVDQLEGPLYQLENGGHTFEITCLMDGAAASVSGTVSARFLRADEETVYFTGTLTGNVVSITLPQSCYVSNGRFGLVVFVAGNDITSAVYAVAGSVYRSTSDHIIDPTEEIPSLEDLIAKIGECEEATASAQQAASFVSSIIASTYSTSVVYAVGDYCTYEGAMYRCTAETDGAFDPADWEAVKVGTEFQNVDGQIDDLKSAITNTDAELGLTKVQPTISPADGWRLLSSGLASNNSAWRLIKYQVTAGDEILIKSAAPLSDGASFQFQTASSVSSSSNPYIVGSPVTVKTDAFVTVPETAMYLILSALKTDDVCGVYKYNALNDIANNAQAVNDKLKLITDADNIIVPGANYSFTATGSGTWQSGYAMNSDFDVTGRSTITITAESANGYGVSLLTLLFYSDSDKQTQIGRRDVDYTFNSNPYRRIDVPSGAVICNIKVCLISSSFGDYIPSAGDVAYINGLTIYFDSLTLNSSIELPQLAKLDQSAIYVLPQTWQDKIQPIQSAQAGLFTFAVQTDTHFGEVGTGVYANTYADLMNNLSKMTEYVGFDFICNLGDIVRGYTADTTVKMLEAYTELMHRYVTNLRCPLFVIPGNHDTNVMYATAQSDPTLQIDKGDMYSKLMPFVRASAPNIVQNGRSLYYYMDFEESDIRAIFLNTTDGNYSGSTIGSTFVISNEQLTWFTSVAMNTTKKIALFAHAPLISGLSSNSVTNASNVLNALYAYKSGGGTVIGCFYGHTHKQDSKVDDNGLLHITFDCGGACTEIVIIDTANKTISTIGIGKSTGGTTIQDRSFSYT